MATFADFLVECNNLHVSTEEFTSVWCPRCANTECTRSTAGKGLFDARVRTWEERLFKNPSKLPETDPRFSIISAKAFQEVPVGQPYVVRGWDVEPSAPLITLPVPEGQRTEVLPPDMPLVGQQVQPLLQKPVPSAPLGNTPNQRGQMVRGSNETIVQPGGRFRIKSNPTPVETGVVSTEGEIKK